MKMQADECSGPGLMRSGSNPGALRLLYRNLTAGRHGHGEYASAQERHANEWSALRHEHLNRDLAPVPEDARPVVAGLHGAPVGEHGNAPSDEGHRERAHNVER